MRRHLSLPLLTLFSLALAALPAAAGGPNTVALRLGGFFPDADSEFWDGSRESFTFESSDLWGAQLGASLLTPITNHLEVGFNGAVYFSDHVSSTRGFHDRFGPVFHDTELTIVPLSVDLRVLPGGRFSTWSDRNGEYREARVAPYFGGGVGVAFWNYEEFGDFVDHRPDPFVFYDEFQETGAAFTVHAVAGVSVPVSHDWSLVFEGRYQWAEDRFEDEFAGLGDIDLSGMSFTVGASFSF